MTRVPSSMSTMPAVRGLVLLHLVNRGCWSWVSMSPRPVSANTAPEGSPPNALPAVVRTLEQYDPARMQAIVATTKQIANKLRPLLGNRLRETPTTVQIAADDILEIAMEHGGVNEAPVVPYEASAALSMLLLRNYGMLMVHFVGVPPGTADLLIKFVPPEALERFGGAGKYAQAVNSSLTRLGELLREPQSVRDLLLGRN